LYENLCSKIVTTNNFLHDWLFVKMMLMDQTKVHQQFVILALTVAWKPKSNRYLYMRPVFVSVQSPLDWKFYFDIDDVVKTLLLLSGDW